MELEEGVDGAFWEQFAWVERYVLLGFFNVLFSCTGDVENMVLTTSHRHFQEPAAWTAGGPALR